ncbi:hypothetical protein JRO89_XS08G0223000 [Xanthoceras sorbifolium]|uniref:Uncharacterized protein n=1 Tax=Xanthoceras sorbifolium TaxID=99658 RepID=A0ABQ8HQV0_9ROSI|nr:hypothetical protein JRO89_XS08G0223000 [Xanthoceras sorbifolium]
MEVQPISIQIQILENLFKIGDEFVQGRPQNCCGSKLVVYDDDNIRVEFPGLQTGGTLVACPPGRPRYCPHNELINHSAQCAPATDTICTMLVLAWDLILKRLLSLAEDSTIPLFAELSFNGSLLHRGLPSRYRLNMHEGIEREGSEEDQKVVILMNIEIVVMLLKKMNM